MKKNKVLKVMALLVCAILLVVGSVAGTFAYLTDKTESVKNTFTIGKIDIELTENEHGDDYKFKMIPGKEYDKDPTVIVKQGSEDCWLFVKIDKADNFEYYVSWTIAEGWTELTTGSGVYYRVVTAEDVKNDNKKFSIIKDNTVTINENLTNATMPTDNPEMTFTAYAVQQDGFADVADAWTVAKDAEIYAPTSNS